ncbi:MAG: EAL domain-containing protein [Methylococcales bacterium]
MAEGIETIEQGEILLTMGCKYGQGYYIAKPMPAADMPTWKANWQIPETWKNALEDSL